jgi:hypothetical protein
MLDLQLNKRGHTIAAALGIITGLSILYFLLMTLAYIPPNSAVQKHAGWSIQITEEEIALYGNSHHPALDIGNTVILTDSFAEKWLLEKTLKNTENPVYAAVDVNNGGRYWHGNIAVLRFLMLIMGIKTIRYLNIFLILLLLFASAHLLAKKTNFMTSLGYLVSLGMCHVYLLPFSIDYTPVFIIMMASVIIVCRFYNRWNESRLFYFFVITGSVTNFIDYLTVPLVTLLYPLIVCFYFEQVKENTSFSKKLFFILKNSTAWFLGYGLNWMIKWLLLLIFQGPSSIKEVIRQIAYRTFNSTGNDPVFAGPVLTKVDPAAEWNVFLAFKYNISKMFPSITVLFAITVLVIWFCVFVILRKKNNRVFQLAPVLLICLYPYIWYLVLNQHSYVHSWFTFRIQGGGIFAVLLFLINSVDLDSLRSLTAARRCGLFGRKRET